MKCPRCGAENEEGKVMCWNCYGSLEVGAEPAVPLKLEEVEKVEGEMVVPRRVRVFPLKKILAIVVVLAVIGGGAYWYLFLRITGEQVMDKLAKAYSGIQDMKVSAAISAIGNIQGMETKMQMAVKALFKQPDKLYIDVSDSMFATTLACDGKNFYIYFPAMKKCIKQPVPEELKKRVLKGISSGVVTADAIKKELGEPKLIGKGKVGNFKCYVLEFVPKKAALPGPMRIKLWVGKKDFLLHQAGMEMQEAGAEKGKPAAMKMTAIVEKQEFNTNIPDSQFAFKPPKGVKVVSEFGMPAMPMPPMMGWPK